MDASLRLLSLNLRRDMASDGDNRWSRRKQAVAALLERQSPHLLATQEGLSHQLADVDAALPGWRRVGLDRRGDGSDEHTAIHYDPRRLLLVAWGDLWLSDTPELPGSATWGNRLPRMATWARFTDQETGRSFTLVNTHLDHESAASRERAAAFLAARFPDAVLVGDFNDAPGSRPHALLTQDRHDLQDGSEQGTYHGFSGTGRSRIDWILAPKGIHGVARTLVPSAGERMVSDHFPLVADLHLTPVRAVPTPVAA